LRGFEFAWACGPPIGMKAPLLRFIDSKRVTRDFRRSVIAIFQHLTAISILGPTQPSAYKDEHFKKTGRL